MLNAFKKHIELQFSELTQASCLLAISGGRDSVVLAHLLKVCHIDFAMAHCNFGLRDAESDRDEQFVKELASTLNVSIHSKRFETKAYAKNAGISTQMAARQLRYSWFEKLQETYKLPFLLTAHHLDDQLETFLMHLNRGSGIDGLTGIPSHNGAVRRPLLPFSRSQITQYALANHIAWREDSSNASDDYLRNALRHQLLPKLYELLPDLQSNLQDSFNYLKGSRDLVGDAVARFRESELKKEDGTTYISINALLKTSNPEAYLYELLKNESPNMEDLMSLLSGQTGKYVSCGNVKVIKDRNRLIFVDSTSVPAQEPVEITDFNTSYEIFDGTVTLRVVDTEDALTFVKNNKAHNTLFFDATLISGAMKLRTWEKGDKMQPYGMRGTKLVSDLLIDNKISLTAKEKVVVLTYNNKILGVLGLRASKHYAVSQQTSQIMMITHTL
ncbi:MAG: tRNA lysidine(34) synthetase TilS [Nonlabens sp.]|nr:tRNA lysidine(34) synthetase TilS [Nonlabens sp.]